MSCRSVASSPTCRAAAVLLSSARCLKDDSDGKWREGDLVENVGGAAITELSRVITIHKMAAGLATAQVSDLYDPREQWASYLINALKAKELQKRDVNYIVKGVRATIAHPSRPSAKATHAICNDAADSDCKLYQEPRVCRVCKSTCFRLRADLLQDEIIIVDEFTGRTMPGRRWGDGLHQAVEAKEGVPIQDETVTLASISYQVPVDTAAASARH